MIVSIMAPAVQVHQAILAHGAGFMPYLPGVAGLLAGVVVLMCTTGLALVRTPNRLTRSLTPYVQVELAERRASRAWRRSIGEIAPLAVATARKVLAAIPLIGDRTQRLQPWLARQLVRADMVITPREVTLTALGLAVGGALLCYALWGSVTMMAPGALAGVGGLVLYIRRRQQRRLRLFAEQLPEVLAILIISVRAGFSVMQALDNIGRQTRPPSSVEFDTVIREMRIGIPAEQALMNLALRVRNADLHLLINTIKIHRETGGNLVAMMETIESTVRERVRLRGEVRTLTAQTTMAGWIITLLPVVLFAALCLINLSGMSFFWTNPIGMGLAGVATLMVCSGNVVLRRITKIGL